MSGPDAEVARVIAWCRIVLALDRPIAGAQDVTPHDLGRPFGIARGDRIDDGVGMKSRNKELPIEAIHSTAEPYQAIEDVLAVEQMFEPGELFRVDNR